MSIKTEEEIAIEKQMHLDDLLSNGTRTEDGVFHFNLEGAKFFILYFNTAKILNIPAIEWRGANGEMVTMTTDKAQEYVIEIITTLKKVL